MTHETTTDQADANAELRAEVVSHLRMLAMGRLGSATRLAEILVPAAPEFVALPVIDASAPAGDAPVDPLKAKTAKAKGK